MILKAKAIVVGDEKSVLRDGAVLVNNRKIEKVGPAAELSALYPKEMVTDYGDATILPGLIDMHHHLGATCAFYPDPSAFEREMIALAAYKEVRDALARGVTTIRDVGSAPNTASQLVAAETAGVLVDKIPRILYSASAICSTGGHGWRTGICLEADGEAEIRKAIRANWKNGARWIKMMTDERTDISEYTPEELKAAVDEIHKLGLKGAMHTSRQPGLQYTIDAGFDTIEHGWFLTREQTLQMIEKGIGLVCTLYIHKVVLIELNKQKEERGFESFSAYDWSSWEKYNEYGAYLKEHFMPDMAEQGVTLLAGTDMLMPGYPPCPVAQEVETMAEYGVGSLRAIASATGNAAKALGLENVIGKIAEGLNADILVVKGDATKDVRALDGVLAVYKDGEEV